MAFCLRFELCFIVGFFFFFSLTFYGIVWKQSFHGRYLLIVCFYPQCPDFILFEEIYYLQSIITGMKE